MTLVLPEELRKRSTLIGETAWLDELPAIVAGLARDWSLTVGATRFGGTEALVVEATLDDGTAAALKVGPPQDRDDLGREATVLRLADGEGCVRLLRDDLDRCALLLERLGPAMFDVELAPATRQDLLCDAAMRMWRPVDADAGLHPGRAKAAWYTEFIPRMWRESGHRCSERVVSDAVACAERRLTAYDEAREVLVHGDIHRGNALQASDGTFKLIDPDGLRCEPEHDLGVLLRDDAGAGDLHDRADRLAARSGLDRTAIWEWGCAERVATALYCVVVGFQPTGDLLLADAEGLRS